jgi:hypothetical protein
MQIILKSEGRFTYENHLLYVLSNRLTLFPTWMNGCRAPTIFVPQLLLPPTDQWSYKTGKVLGRDMLSSYRVKSPPSAFSLLRVAGSIEYFNFRLFYFRCRELGTTESPNILKDTVLCLFREHDGLCKANLGNVAGSTHWDNLRLLLILFDIRVGVMVIDG